MIKVPLTKSTVRLLLTGVAVLFVASCSTQPVSTQKPEAGPPTQTASKHLVIAAVGDIMLDGSAREIMQEHGYDYAFDKMRPWLQKADIRRRTRNSCSVRHRQKWRQR